MPASDTGLRVSGLMNDLPEVKLSESECSGKPDLPPLNNCKRSWRTIIIHRTKKQESLGSSVLARG